MRISIDPLDPKSVQSALDKIVAYENSLNSKCMELAQRLAEIGMETAQVAYAGAVAEGNDAVDVSIEPTDTGYRIIASGHDVYFVEFGTGVSSGNGYDTSEITPPVDIQPGSWSEAHDGPFHRNGYWWYGKKRYVGTRPYMGMYYASKAVKENIERVAKEVFK